MLHMSRQGATFLISCALLLGWYVVPSKAADAEVVNEKVRNVPAWAARVIERRHGPPESDAILIDVFLVEKGRRRLLAKDIVGPLVLFEGERKILSCESQGSAMIGYGPMVLGLDGQKIKGPKHPGYLRDCARIERSDLLLLHYNLVKDGKPYNFARILGTDGKVVHDKVLPGAGEFSIERNGKNYQIRLSEPEVPG